MDTMRLLLTEIDLLTTLQQTSASFGETTYPPGGSWGPGWLSHVSVVLVHTGSARVTVAGEPELVIPAGWLSLRLPHRREHYLMDDAIVTHHAWIHLRLDEWTAAILDRFERLPRVLPVSDMMSRLVAEGIALARMPLSTTGPLLASLAAAVVWRYVGEAESNGRGDSDPVERAQRYMLTHVHDPGLDLRRVADAASVSPSYLVRRFRRDVGVTPIAYLWRRRVAVGIDLLTSTGLPVGAIANRAGFSSPYHFSRRIKAATGLPPTEVRRRHWSRDENVDDLVRPLGPR
jgi:AraC-like DNA-binding protein